MLTIGSLFSGIGGLELGLEWAGLGPTLWQVEQSEFCRGVLARHWPDARRYTDVKEYCGVTFAEVDIICGGFPCQPFSSASRGRKVAEDLWPDMLRIVQWKRPRFVVAENVAPDPIERAADDLRDQGYAATTIEVSAAMVGAPHERERWFVVAHTDRESESRRPIHAEVASVSDIPGLFWSHDPGSMALDDGVPSRVDHIRALGNAVVPQVAEVIGRIVLSVASAMVTSKR